MTPRRLTSGLALGLLALGWPVGCILWLGWGLVSLVVAVSGGYVLAFLSVYTLTNHKSVI
jgi:hypothetical protein